ncbi:MAG: hypothetical protein ACREHD_02120, partial [Pirellulales bacterium]
MNSDKEETPFDSKAAQATPAIPGLPAVRGNTGYRGYPVHAPAGPSASHAGAFTVGDAWLVLRRWGWKCIAGGFVLASIAAAGVWFTFVPTYEAAAFLEIRSRPIVIAFE